MFGLAQKKTRILLSNESSRERISVILPVLNEARRIERCLAGLSAQPEEVREIPVVDGGSTDGTRAIVARFRGPEPRLRWIDASPVDARWTGKAWGLNFGLERSDPACRWILCVDAYVQLSPAPLPHCGHPGLGRKSFDENIFAAVNRLARWPAVLRGDALSRPTGDRRTLFTERGIIRYQRKALREAVELLAEGRAVVIFPEGYPNIDPGFSPKVGLDDYLPFKPGFLKIVRLAEKRAQRSIPIIPAGLFYEKGDPWIAHISFGAPLYRSQFPSEPALIEETEMRVRELSSMR